MCVCVVWWRRDPHLGSIWRKKVEEDDRKKEREEEGERRWEQDSTSTRAVGEQVGMGVATGTGRHEGRGTDQGGLEASCACPFPMPAPFALPVTMPYTHLACFASALHACPVLLTLPCFTACNLPSLPSASWEEGELHSLTLLSLYLTHILLKALLHCILHLHLPALDLHLGAVSLHSMASMP